MNRPTLLFYDSGIGGLPYLAACRSHLPNIDYIFLADNAFFPYGEKDSCIIKDRTDMVIEKALGKWSPEAVVIACNTASVVALETLRQNHSVRFIGTVPAVKPAAERSKAKKILLLSTSGTAADPYTDRLIETYAKEVAIFKVGLPGLVTFVENRLYSSAETERREAIEEVVVLAYEEGVDKVVLGCTHFLHLKDEITQRLGENIEVVDSVDGVINQILLLFGGVREAIPIEEQNDSLFLTAPPNDKWVYFADKYKLNICGLYEK